MLILSILTIACLLLSTWYDYKRTIAGVKKGLSMFVNLMPALLIILSLVSIVFFLIPHDQLVVLMGTDAGVQGWLIAALLGSVAMIPGFIAFPLCGVLIKSGIAYTSVAVFITTLTMVGFISLPLEAKFFGWRTSIIRNTLSFIAALLIGLIMMFFL